MRPLFFLFFFLFCRYVLYVCVLIPVKESRSILTHLFYIFYFFCFFFLNAFFFVSHHDCQILNWFSLIYWRPYVLASSNTFFFVFRFEFCDIRVVSSSFFFDILFILFPCSVFFSLVLVFFFLCSCSCLRYSFKYILTLYSRWQWNFIYSFFFKLKEN